MPLINELHLNGRIATPPEQRGKGPTRFRLAHGGGGKRKDGSPWPTMFFSVACWHKSALELNKGARIELSGKLRDSSYLKDGVQHSAVEIVADNIVVEPELGQPAPLTPNSFINDHGVGVSNDDVPF